MIRITHSMNDSNAFDIRIRCPTLTSLISWDDKKITIVVSAVLSM